MVIVSIVTRKAQNLYRYGTMIETDIHKVSWHCSLSLVQRIIFGGFQAIVDAWSYYADDDTILVINKKIYC
jgi:hypothetical protein